MPINPKLLVKKMLDAARAVLADDEMDARELVEMQVRTLAHVVTEIERLNRTGKIDGERARLLFDMHRSAARSALTMLEKIGVNAAERIITAAIAALGTVALRALGLQTR